jgi:hypothetical protein
MPFVKKHERNLHTRLTVKKQKILQKGIVYNEDMTYSEWEKANNLVSANFHKLFGLLQKKVRIADNKIKNDQWNTRSKLIDELIKDSTTNKKELIINSPFETNLNQDMYDKIKRYNDKDIDVPYGYSPGIFYSTPLYGTKFERQTNKELKETIRGYFGSKLEQHRYDDKRFEEYFERDRKERRLVGISNSLNDINENFKNLDEVYERRKLVVKLERLIKEVEKIRDSW